jgi:hypothetical protein
MSDVIENDMDQNEPQEDVEVSLRDELMAAMSAADAGEDAPVDAPAAAEESPQPVEVKAIDIPSNWNDAKIKEKWSTLPPEVQEFIVAREQEVHKGFTRFDEERNFGRAMKEAVTPYLAHIQSLGATPQQAVNYLLNAEYTLRTGSEQQKAQLFRQMAADYGVNIGSLAEDNSDMYADPQVSELQQRLAALEQERQRDMMMMQQQQAQTIHTDIASFAADPANSHFEAVRPDMVRILQLGHADNLQQAYEMACRYNPNVQAAIAAEQQAAAARAKAEAAKAAKMKAVSVTGSTGPAGYNGSPPSNGSIRDSLMSAWAEAEGRY